MFSSFHQSLNGSLANLSISTNKTPNNRAGKNEKKLNKSGSRLTKTPVTDRFVPDRSNFEMSHYLLQSADAANRSLKNANGNSDVEGNNSDKKINNSVYSKSLTENMLGVSDLNSVRVLSFAQKPKGPPEVFSLKSYMCIELTRYKNYNYFFLFDRVIKMLLKLCTKVLQEMPRIPPANTECTLNLRTVSWTLQISSMIST